MENVMHLAVKDDVLKKLLFESNNYSTKLNNIQLEIKNYLKEKAKTKTLSKKNLNSRMTNTNKSELISQLKNYRVK